MTDHATAKWMPIETAPKDGRLILARGPNGDDFAGTFVVYWADHETTWKFAIDKPLGGLSHWMVLPPPPVDPER